MTRLTLVGECNRCGACCSFVDARGTRWSCEHLDVLGPIGTPNATRCRVHAQRYDDMPVWDHASDGRQRRAPCRLGCARETEAIIRRGKGCCSYRVAEAAPDDRRPIVLEWESLPVPIGALA